MANLAFVFKLLPAELLDIFVVNGCSAGGLATYTWVDQIAEYIKQRNPIAKIYGLADSGFFIDYPSNMTGIHIFSGWMKAVVDLANHRVPLPNKKCLKDN